MVYQTHPTVLLEFLGNSRGQLQVLGLRAMMERTKIYDEKRNAGSHLRLSVQTSRLVFVKRVLEKKS